MPTTQPADGGRRTPLGVGRTAWTRRPVSWSPPARGWSGRASPSSRETLASPDRRGATYTPRVRIGGHRRRVLGSALLGLSLLALLPATASAHLLFGRFESPLPLVVYLAAAAVAVGLSFAVVLGRSPAGVVAAAAASGAPAQAGSEQRIAVPRNLRLAIRALGLVGWLWVVVQGLLGGSGDADVGSLILWTYGWVVLPILSAFVAPVWEWLDPFATLHDLGAAALRRLGVRPWQVVTYPAGLDRWPAVVAFVVFVWLELVYTNARAGRTLTIVLLLYTAWTLAMMAQFGRDTWRRQGETFTVWLGLLNRLAPLTADDERDAATLRGGRSGPACSRQPGRPQS